MNSNDASGSKFELLVERRHGRQADMVEQQRVAVGLGLGDLHRADRAAGTGDVLHHHRLVEPRLQAFGQHAAQEVAAAARRVGHDQGDRLAGVGAPARPPATPRPERKNQSRDAVHLFLPVHFLSEDAKLRGMKIDKPDPRIGAIATDVDVRSLSDSRLERTLPRLARRHRAGRARPDPHHRGIPRLLAPLRPAEAASRARRRAIPSIPSSP